MSAISRPIEWLHQPEHTGEDRCLPCTVTNVAIAAVLSVAVGLVSIPAAAGTFVLSLVLVYYRGYLVPGTPTLTRRYFPKSVLRLYGKAVAPSAVDPEPVLRDIGAIEDCGDDLCLRPAFRERWRDNLEGLRAEGIEGALADFLGVDGVDVRGEDGACVVYGDGEAVLVRESRAALLADLAALPEFRARYDGWDGLSSSEKSAYLGGLRVYLEDCPECGGRLALGSETVESCCGSESVAALECEGCGARLAEVPA